jgi:tRNA A-37 threonylcarbamoyl transferase component Bud32
VPPEHPDLTHTLTRQTLAGRPRRLLHRGRNLSKGTIELIEVGERPVVLKDLSARPWPVRLVLGPWQLDREANAYRLLQGVPGTPRFLGRVDRQAIVLEYVPGRDLAAVKPGELSESFFDRLDRLLDAIHARGVAHGDLHRHDVLAGPGGQPYLVDFSTSLVAGPSADPLLRFLFDQMCRADHRAAAKLRHRFVRGSRREVPPRPGLYRIGERLKRVWNVLRRKRTGT